MSSWGCPWPTTSHALDTCPTPRLEPMDALRRQRFSSPATVIPGRAVGPPHPGPPVADRGRCAGSEDLPGGADQLLADQQANERRAASAGRPGKSGGPSSVKGSPGRPRCPALAAHPEPHQETVYRCRPGQGQQIVWYFLPGQGSSAVRVFAGRRRQGWDSNPWTPCDVNGFRDRPIRPLWHLAVPEYSGPVSGGRRRRNGGGRRRRGRARPAGPRPDGAGGGRGRGRTGR